jgi:hypothetical protein
MAVGRPGSSALSQSHAPMRPRPVRSLPGTRALVKERAIPRGHYVSGPTRPRSQAPSHAEEGRRQLRTTYQDSDAESVPSGAYPPTRCGHPSATRGEILIGVAVNARVEDSVEADDVDRTGATQSDTKTMDMRAPDPPRPRICPTFTQRRAMSRDDISPRRETPCCSAGS